ncbi:MAG: hypothetical protein R2695_15665 [Acidimicrobiales bacterium]
MRRTQTALDAEADASGSAPEDAAVVARIEERHATFEAAQARAEQARRMSFVGGAVAAWPRCRRCCGSARRSPCSS